MEIPSRRAVFAPFPDRGTASLALFAGVAGVAGSFAVAGFTPSFVGGPIAGFLSRRLPAAVVTATILLLGSAGEALNVATALAVATLLFAGTTLAGLLGGRRLGVPRFGPPLAAAVTALAAYAVTGAPVASLSAGGAVGAVTAVADLVSGPAAESVAADRRRFLGGLGSALAVGAGGYVLGSRGGFSPSTAAGEPLDVDASMRAELDSLLAAADEKSLGVDGLEPLVSESFYEVDINATDPTVAADEWSLSVTGAVEEELTYAYEDVREREAENRFVTLRCVGEELNGEKMDNALWTGVPITDLVEPAGPADECCVMLRAADGYYEQFPLSALEGGFLAYGMNGETLPRGHGYPVRALIPGHWGEINVKWITEIEVLEEELEGYWEERGWHGTGPVETVAKLHLVEGTDGGRVRVGGHAYAGTRGIRRVEVSTDGGETWSEADLSEPLPGDDVWRQWTYAYDPDGDHEVVVRATDGEGSLQPEAETDAFPSGPTGWVSRTVEW